MTKQVIVPVIVRGKECYIFHATQSVAMLAATKITTINRLIDYLCIFYTKFYDNINKSEIVPVYFKSLSCHYNNC